MDVNREHVYVAVGKAAVLCCGPLRALAELGYGQSGAAANTPRHETCVLSAATSVDVYVRVSRSRWTTGIFMDHLDESNPLHAARLQRRGVRAALVALESATASPATDQSWAPMLQERLNALRSAFSHHIEVTEGDGGLFEETVTLAPRLVRRTKGLHDDHVAIMAAIDAALDVVPTSVGLHSDEAVAAVRATTTDVMGRITRHRQLGADLVYEAYNVDIEGGD